MVCACVTAGNDYQKEQQFRKLNSVADERKHVDVIRDGKTKSIHVSDLVVGDVVKISIGMEIPTDGYLLEGTEIYCDESSMSGESERVHKTILSQCLNVQRQVEESGNKNEVGHHHVPSPVLLSGTKVVTHSFLS